LIAAQLYVRPIRAAASAPRHQQRWLCSLLVVYVYIHILVDTKAEPSNSDQRIITSKEARIFVRPIRAAASAPRRHMRWSSSCVIIYLYHVYICMIIYY